MGARGGALGAGVDGELRGRAGRAGDGARGERGGPRCGGGGGQAGAGQVRAAGERHVHARRAVQLASVLGGVPGHRESRLRQQVRGGVLRRVDVRDARIRTLCRVLRACGRLTCGP